MNDNNDTPQPGDVCPADQQVAAVSAASLRATIETLARFEQFFRHHASDTVHAELRAFCTRQGWHGVCAAQTLLDDLGFNAFALRHALGHDDNAHRDLDRP
jgi:hypothetical protein